MREVTLPRRGRVDPPQQILEVGRVAATLYANPFEQAHKGRQQHAEEQRCDDGDENGRCEIEKVNTNRMNMPTIAPE
jgi:hypothetical protein